MFVFIDYVMRQILFFVYLGITYYRYVKLDYCVETTPPTGQQAVYGNYLCKQLVLMKECLKIRKIVFYSENQLTKL